MFWFRSAHTARRNPSTRRRGLHFEPLEQRRMLTLATVTATGGGNYLVQDDSAGHDIKIKWEQMGDVNFDGIVNSEDQAIVSAALGTTDRAADANFDGTVNISDLALISASWGQASQIEFFDGSTNIGSVNLTSISSIKVDAGSDSDTIEVDGNLPRDVTVNGTGATALKITGNPGRSDDAVSVDAVSADNSAITLFNGTSTVSFLNSGIGSVELALGTTTGADSVTINGTSGSDNIYVPAGESNTVNLNGLPIILDEYSALTINGNDGDDTIDASQISASFALTINGGAGDDILAGGPGNDTINGGAGNDTLIGWGGNDTMSGGTGSDTFLYMPGPTSLGTDTLSESSGGVATLDFEYMPNAVTINIGSTSTQSNVISGLLGITLSTSTTITNVIGGSGNDTITGNSLNNVLDGRGGDDTIQAGSGNAVMYGGDGDDTLIGGSGNDLFYGDAGDDTLEGGTGTNTYVFPWSPNDEPLGDDTIQAGSSDTVDVASFFPATYSVPTLTSTPQTVGTDASANPVLTLSVSSGTVSTVTPPQSTAPTIGGLSVDTQSDPGNVILTAINVPADASEVDFYLDTNRNGVVDPGTDEEIGVATDSTQGWSKVVADDSIAGADPAFLVVPAVGGVPAAAGIGPGTAPAGGNPVGMPPGPFPPGIPLGPNDDIIYGAPSLTRSPTDAPVSMFHQDETVTIEGTDNQNFTDSETNRSVVVGGENAKSTTSNEVGGTAESAATGGSGGSATGGTGGPLSGLSFSAVSSFSASAVTTDTGEGSVGQDSADVTDNGDTWTVNANGAPIDGVPITHVTIAGWLVYGVASGTNESGLGNTNVAANAVATISGGGNIVSLDTDTGVITTTLPNGTQILSSSVGDDNTYMYSVYFVWTIPVGGTINASFAVGEAATAWSGQDNPISAGSSSASGVQLLSGGATIVGWDSN